MTNTTSTVLSEIRDKAGIITLNRPQALNALDLEMVREMRRVLEKWAFDDAVQLVILRGAGERALCAGGDIASLYRDAREGGNEGAVFWREEYELNHLISTYPKPYVALMTGIVLGGGIGVSAHASHRVVTDDSRIGMPETGIGFAPDAGGSHLLAASPDRLGRHLAYTSLHVGAAEAIDTGFADFYVPQDQLEGLVDKLAHSGDPEQIHTFAGDPGQGFGADRAEMVEVYAADTAEETLRRLDEANGEWAEKAAKAMRRNSPHSIKVTEEALNRNEGRDLAEALNQEFWVSLNLQRFPDFVEGVRAQIIDKDRSPAWEHDCLENVPADTVSAMFEPIEGQTPPSFTTS
ncbi:enoyl-CoA hydratase/isomerase family protein [Corynebacterium mayonis]|uniref:enoyl-CoA hydratase/isomerase family protein n=1 Tax=Corynebacterium mayonis TaxID=3062461 RepID=UPI0031403ED8